jgi:hypothetical protein
VDWNNKSDKDIAEILLPSIIGMPWEALSKKTHDTIDNALVMKGPKSRAEKNWQMDPLDKVNFLHDFFGEYILNTVTMYLNMSTHLK